MEIELKFRLENPEEAIQTLNQISQLKSEEFQKDIYFTPFHRNFISEKPISEWLRVREIKDKKILTYKKWHNSPEKKAISCDEYETEISDINNLKNILKSLNFSELIIVNKLRKNWEFKDTLISIDDVDEIGHFIEIEANKEFQSIEEAKEHLYNILKELNIKTGLQDYEGYPFLLLKKKNLF